MATVMARTISTALAILALVLQACSPAAAEEHRAVQVFRAFQAALFRGEVASIRPLLTRKSRQFARAIANQRLEGRQPLEVLGTSKVRHQLRVHVKDPNDGGRESFFVLVREDGRIRVDLLATTTYNKEERRRPGPREIVRQRRLSQREIARIRTMTPEVIR